MPLVGPVVCGCESIDFLSGSRFFCYPPASLYVTVTPSTGELPTISVQKGVRLLLTWELSYASARLLVGHTQVSELAFDMDYLGFIILDAAHSWKPLSSDTK